MFAATMSNGREVPGAPTFRSSHSHQYKKLMCYKGHLNRKKLLKPSFSHECEAAASDTSYNGQMFRPVPIRDPTNCYFRPATSALKPSPRMPPLLKLSPSEPKEIFCDLVHGMMNMSELPPVPSADVHRAVHRHGDAKEYLDSPLLSHRLQTPQTQPERNTDPRSPTYDPPNKFFSGNGSCMRSCSDGPTGVGYKRSYPAPSGADKPAFLDYPTHSPSHLIPHQHDKAKHLSAHTDLHSPISLTNHYNDACSPRVSTHSYHTEVDRFASQPCLQKSPKFGQHRYRKNFPPPSGIEKSACLDGLLADRISQDQDAIIPYLLDQSHTSSPQPPPSPFLGAYKYGPDEDSPTNMHLAHTTYQARSSINEAECSNQRTCLKSSLIHRPHSTHCEPDLQLPSCSREPAPLNQAESHDVKFDQTSSYLHSDQMCPQSESSRHTTCASVKSPTAPANESSCDTHLTPPRRGPGRPRKPENERKRKPAKSIPLWKFLLNLLHDPATCPELVKWEDISKGTFRIVRSDVVAARWGMRKDNTKMNYEKFSRAMRYYYKQHIFEAVPGKRLVYQFGLAAKDWRPKNLQDPNFENLQC